MSMTSLPSGDFSRCWRSKRASSGARQHLGVRADQDAGDRTLHLQRTRAREQVRNLLQALRIGQALPRERLERAHLRAGSRHARDARHHRAHLVHAVQRPVTQVGLRHRHVVVVWAGECPHGPLMCRGIAQARQHRSVGHAVRACHGGGLQLARERRLSASGASSTRDRPRACRCGRSPCGAPAFGRIRSAPARASTNPAREPIRTCGPAPWPDRRRARTPENARGRRGRASIAVSAAATSGLARCGAPIDRRVALDMIEEHAHVGHVTPQHLVHEGDLLRVARPVVGETAHVAAKGRVWVGVGQAGHRDHRGGTEQLEQRRARAAAGDFARRRGLEIAIEQRAGDSARAAPSTRNRREPARL